MTGEDEKTVVDLAEDLLEKTNLKGKAPQVQNTSNASQEWEISYQTAVILRREGFQQESKRVLRALLRLNPDDDRANELLSEIQKEEADQLVRGSLPPDWNFSELDKVHPEGVSASEAFERLSREFDTELDLEIPFRLSLLEEGAEAKDESVQALEKTLTELSYRDRIDLGVSFLEIGFAEAALRQFDEALQLLKRHRMGSLDENCSRSWVAAGTLKAQALLRMEEVNEAIFALDESLKEVWERPEEEKLEIYYWNARAYEKWGKTRLAVEWYQRLIDIDPDYRDAKDRYGQVQKQAPKKGETEKD